MRITFLSAAALIVLSSCSQSTESAPETPPPSSDAAGMAAADTTGEVSADEKLDRLARRYVHLALAFGEHDANYVDAYSGPPEWRAAATATERSLDDLQDEAAMLGAELSVLTPPEGEEARHRMLAGNITAMIARIRLLRGEALPFNDETALIYDAVPPAYEQAEFDAALEALDEVVPGSGPLPERISAFESRLVVPEDKIEDVMHAAIDACRSRTLDHLDLPAEERFELEFVTDKPWSGYNWYQGDYHSLIQVNLDQPFRITRALDLGCHEGYPGHHVANIFMERDRLVGNGWEEYYLVPLFSPMAFFMEGSANYGLHIAFPGDRKLAFEKEVLYPLAGLDPALADIHAEIAAARAPLSHVSIWIARQYLDGDITREDAIDLYTKYGLRSRERAAQSMDFIDTYRGYIINYSLGEDMVRDWVEANAQSEEARWDVFRDLLETPVSASDIALPDSTAAE